MSTPDQSIEPAFSAEDWAHILPACQANPHQTMALANAALPDDDPRKITRADADGLSRLIDDEFPFTGKHVWPQAIFLRTLAAKLDALLPPE
jgi:hypothetical protein